ncbi:MAG: carbohydrate porin [Bacteroidales bacterium]
MKNLLLSFLIICLSVFYTPAQNAYQKVENKKFSLGSYGRVGVDWSFENGGSIGRRLNLNNMGSIGGRMEEQDYLELAPALQFNPAKGDSTIVNVQMRFALYSQSLSLFGNSSTSSAGGLTLAVPELFAEARHIAGKDLNIWIGARLYRGPDIHIADHFYFNDHSGQGFGIEYKSTRFATLFISSTDTNATVPPYFYLNIKTGTPNLALRQRVVLVLEQDVQMCDDCSLTFLGEFHRLANANADADTIGSPLNYPSDFGYVFGVRHTRKLPKFTEGSYNQFALRYGGRIANGGDGGMSRTWLTFGAPNLETGKFKSAWSFSMVDEILLNLSKLYTLNAYLIYTLSHGAAESDNLSATYFGQEVYNRKKDFTLGTRSTFYLSRFFHLLAEVHYAARTDGTQDKASLLKFSLAPTLVPTGGKDQWARPHLRFVTSIGRYNDQAMKTLYSPYLSYVGEKRWGYYIGVKAEWWLF